MIDGKTIRPDDIISAVYKYCVGGVVTIHPCTADSRVGFRPISPVHPSEIEIKVHESLNFKVIQNSETVHAITFTDVYDITSLDNCRSVSQLAPSKVLINKQTWGTENDLKSRKYTLYGHHYS